VRKALRPGRGRLLGLGKAGDETIRRVSICGVYGEWEEADGWVDIDIEY
jgi:hypothetical protein